MGVHLLHRLDVVLVFDLDGFVELNLQLFLILDDLSARLSLNFDVLQR